MERLRAVAQVWNWLPAFRVVAETEHLPTASEAIGVSPSALSRTINQLEEQLGQTLFRRVGRRLELNAAGHALLASVRQGMRTIHGALEGLDGRELAGPLLLSAFGAATQALLLPAALDLRRQHSGLDVRLETVAPERVTERLLQGGLDLALVSRCVEHEQLATRHVLDLPLRLYCGPGHPLYGVAGPVDWEAHAFVAPPADPLGRPSDGWPVVTPRRIGLTVSRMELGVRACETGQLLAVLPEAAAGTIARLDLHALDGPILPPTPVYAIRRTPVGPDGRAEVALAAIHEAATSLIC